MTAPKVYISVHEWHHQIPQDVIIRDYTLNSGVRSHDSFTVSEDQEHDEISVSVWTEYEGASLHFTRAQFQPFLEMLLDRFIGGLEVTPEDADKINEESLGLSPRPR